MKSVAPIAGAREVANPEIRFPWSERGLKKGKYCSTLEAAPRASPTTAVTIQNSTSIFP